jgi:DNA-binding transcriptional MocR family regulator
LLQYNQLNVPEQYRIHGRTARGIAEDVESAVCAAHFAPGAQLPTVRDLARRLRVSPTTVAAAYQRLRLRGVIAGRGRQGTRVAYRPPLPTTSPAAAPAGLRNLADGNPDPRLLPPLPVLPRRSATRLYGEGVQLPELAAEAARQFHADGIDGALAIVSGGLDGIERVLQARLAPGDRVAVEDPGFTGVLDLVSALGLVPEPVQIDDEGPVPADLARALREGVGALIITPRAQNPTGAALDRARARELRAILDRHPRVLVIEDDHAGPVAGVPAVSLCPRAESWAVVRSVSKSLGPDLRLAVIAGDPATVARVEGRQRLGMGWVSHLLQRSVAALWADRRIVERFATAAATYAKRRSALIASLAAHGIAAYGRTGLNVWIPVPEEAAAVAGLAERGWAVRAGEPYRRKTGPAIRVTIATLEREDAKRLAADLREVLDVGRPISAIR